MIQDNIKRVRWQFQSNTLRYFIKSSIPKSFSLNPLLKKNLTLQAYFYSHTMLWLCPKNEFLNFFRDIKKVLSVYSFLDSIKVFCCFFVEAHVLKHLLYGLLYYQKLWKFLEVFFKTENCEIVPNLICIAIFFNSLHIYLFVIKRAGLSK